MLGLSSKSSVSMDTSSSFQSLTPLLLLALSFFFSLVFLSFSHFIVSDFLNHFSVFLFLLVFHMFVKDRPLYRDCFFFSTAHDGRTVKLRTERIQSPLVIFDKSIRIYVRTFENIKIKFRNGVGNQMLDGKPL